MAGWDLSPDPPTRVYTIHHPAGDAKKISYSVETCQRDHWFEAPLQLHWKVQPWAKGSTSGGSSGGPLFNHRGLIIGHLHGGSASCLRPEGYDHFGGLAFEWSTCPTKDSRLRDLLNPSKRHVTALRGAYLSALRKRQHQRQRRSNNISNSASNHGNNHRRNRKRITGRLVEHHNQDRHGQDSVVHSIDESLHSYRVLSGSSLIIDSAETIPLLHVDDIVVPLTE